MISRCWKHILVMNRFGSGLASSSFYLKHRFSRVDEVRLPFPPPAGLQGERFEEGVEASSAVYFFGSQVVGFPCLAFPLGAEEEAYSVGILVLD